MCEEIPGATDLVLDELLSVTRNGNKIKIKDWDGEAFILKFESKEWAKISLAEFESGDYVVAVVKDGELLNMY